MFSSLLIGGNMKHVMYTSHTQQTHKIICKQVAMIKKKIRKQFFVVISTSILHTKKGAEDKYIGERKK